MDEYFSTFVDSYVKRRRNYVVCEQVYFCTLIGSFFNKIFLYAARLTKPNLLRFSRSKCKRDDVFLIEILLHVERAKLSYVNEILSLRDYL